MKKILLRTGIGLVILIVIGVLAVGLFLDGAVKRGVETFGPKLTGVDIKLDAVNLSLLSGGGKIQGLVVGNPEGFKTPQAIKVGSASLSLKPASLLSDKIVIKQIKVISPDITFEGGLGGNNLNKILANLNEATGGANAGSSGSSTAASGEKKPGKKLEVDDFLISGAKIHISISGMSGNAVAVPIPDIHLTNMGTDPEGITAAELLKQVFTAIEQSAAKAAAGAVTGLGKDASGLGKDAGNAAGKITKGIGDLFKK